ncbi:anti-sigma factor family protein [Streptomyces sp. P6-2-1]|uniref:anti-sigma factor family protein n=1 Tax=Streptomyces sp. P6-2-1 TaxID=3422591 RepID=UPI003D361C5E
MSETDVHKLLGAYVLGGLSGEDRARFQAHLSTCGECTRELARSAGLPALLRRAAGTFPAFPGPADESGPPSTGTGPATDPEPAAARAGHSPEADASLDRLLAQLRTRRAEEHHRAEPANGTGEVRGTRESHPAPPPRSTHDVPGEPDSSAGPPTPSATAPAASAPATAPTVPPAPESARPSRPARGFRRLRPWNWFVLAAAFVVIAGLGLTPHLTGSSGPDKGPGYEAGAKAAFTPSTGSAVAGDAHLTTKAWGTALSMDMRHLPTDGSFVLRVSSADGREEQVAAWSATTHTRATVAGASSVRADEITALTVVDQSGRVLAVCHPS